MSSQYSPVVENPRPIPWPWRALEALLVAGAAAALLQVIPLPAGGTAVLVGALLVVAIATDVWVRSHYIGTGLERAYAQLLAGLVLLLVAGTLLAIARPAPPPAGLVVSIVIGVAAFVVLSLDQRIQLRRGQAAAARRDAASAHLESIADRGGDHAPGRDDLRGPAAQR